MQETTRQPTAHRGASDHPGLTIRVRQVDHTGRETEAYPAVQIPAGAPLTTSVWPPCECPIHGGSQRRPS
jgi:hypothetical protein